MRYNVGLRFCGSGQWADRQMAGSTHLINHPVFVMHTSPIVDTSWLTWCAILCQGLFFISQKIFDLILSSTASQCKQGNRFSSICEDIELPHTIGHSSNPLKNCPLCAFIAKGEQIPIQIQFEPFALRGMMIEPDYGEKPTNMWFLIGIKGTTRAFFQYPSQS